MVGELREFCGSELVTGRAACVLQRSNMARAAWKLQRAGYYAEGNAPYRGYAGGT